MSLRSFSRSLSIAMQSEVHVISGTDMDAHKHEIHLWSKSRPILQRMIGQSSEGQIELESCDEFQE